MDGGPAKNLVAACALAAFLAIPLSACNAKTEEPEGSGARAAPPVSSFPDPERSSLEDVLGGLGTSDLVVMPAVQVFTPGRNRLGFGVYTVGGEQVADAEVAIYAAHGPDGPAKGPFPARIESLETEPAFTARTTADDPDSAEVVYASEVRLNRHGEWRLVAVVRQDGELTAVRLPSVEVGAHDDIPGPGDEAPAVHTPTLDDVGSVTEIDTRVPPSTMHEHDLAEVVGERPVALLFATPALCQARVCGPVVDIAEQVKRDHGDEVAFIYSEIYEQNDPGRGLREPVEEYGLPTEPWLFVIDAEGTIETRIEGAFSVAELERAIGRVLDGA